MNTSSVRVPKIIRPVVIRPTPIKKVIINIPEFEETSPVGEEYTLGSIRSVEEIPIGKELGLDRSGARNPLPQDDLFKRFDRATYIPSQVEETRRPSQLSENTCYVTVPSPLRQSLVETA